MLGESLIRRGTDALFGKREKVDPKVKKAREICEGLLEDHAWRSNPGHTFHEPVKIDGRVEEVVLYIAVEDSRKAEFIDFSIVGQPERMRISNKTIEVGLNDQDMHPLDDDQLQRHTKILKELRELYPPLPY